MDALSQFTQSQSEEQRSQAQKAMNDASGEGRGSQINVPGTYRMRAKTVIGKDGKVWPRFEISDVPKTKGDLVLKVILECVDSTEVVAKGDIAFINVYVMKGAGATEEKIRNTASFAKPILVALTGKKDIQFTNAFLSEHFSVDVGSDKKVARTHKMNQDVMVVLESSVNQTTGKPYFGMKSLRAAAADDKSRSVKSMAAVTDGALAGDIKSGQGELRASSMNMSDFDGDVPQGDAVVEDS